VHAVIDAKIRALKGTVPRRMFGEDAYMVGGKVFAGWWREELVLKLPPDAHAQAMALPGARAFEPMAGRPMKEWVVLPGPYSSAAVSRLVAAAHAYAPGPRSR
jgi:hypothetical protein